MIEKEQKESRHEEVVMVNENELLESIERTMLQINEELQTEEAMVSQLHCMYCVYTLQKNKNNCRSKRNCTIKKQWSVWFVHDLT